MRRTHKSRKLTKLENSLWHYQKFFREIKQRRIEFMLQKIYRKFHFGISYSDYLVAAGKVEATIVINQTQQSKEKQKLEQALVEVQKALKKVNYSYKQQTTISCSRAKYTTTSQTIAKTPIVNKFTTAIVTTTKSDEVKQTYGKHMPTLAKPKLLRMPLKSRSSVQQLLVKV